jgi:PKD repeat protein
LSALLGAVFSYLWTEAYYIDKGFKVPEGVITVSITNVTFPIDNSAFFDVTVLNPSYSDTDAYITDIALVTSNGDEEIHIIPSEDIQPPTPYLLLRGESETFTCNRAWDEFSGRNVHVVVLLQDDSGATFAHTLGYVGLRIIKTDFDPAVTVKRFNLTIENSFESLIPLNVSQVFIGSSEVPAQNITAQDENTTLPHQLFPGENKTFTLTWNLWTEDVLGSSHDITVRTLQGYSTIYRTLILPPPISLEITDTAFIIPYTDQFNATIHSPLVAGGYSVNIDRVSVTIVPQIFNNVTISPSTELLLQPGENLTIQCLWNWETHKGQEATVTIHTSQGFYASNTTQIQETFGMPVALFEYTPQFPHTYESILFNSSRSYDTYGNIIDYFWDFGDGEIDTGEVVTHSYGDHVNYTVTLLVTDDDGLTDTVLANITVVNQSPIALFSESATTLFTEEIIFLNASQSYDPDGTISTYFWDFGDGKNNTGIFVNHTYLDDGVYVVSLTVTDDDGAINATSALKTILNRPPYASIEASTTAIIDEQILFNASASSDQDGSIENYYWDFGNGENATGITANYAYSTNGTYIVILNVTDNDGAVTQANITITVVPGVPMRTFLLSAESYKDNTSFSLHTFAVKLKFSRLRPENPPTTFI